MVQAWIKSYVRKPSSATAWPKASFLITVFVIIIIIIIITCVCRIYGFNVQTERGEMASPCEHDREKLRHIVI